MYWSSSFVFIIISEILYIIIDRKNFNKIFIDDIFDIYLIQDTICSIEAKGGSNLLSNLEFNVNEQKELRIDDNNTARWTRDYDKIELYISVDTL